jgi:hypothetical protein
MGQLYCPCCGYRLRIRPRNIKFKATLRAKEKIEEGNSTICTTYAEAESPHVRYIQCHSCATASNKK